MGSSLNIQPTCELDGTFCLKFAIDDPATQSKMLSTLIDIAGWHTSSFSRETFCPQTKSELSWSVANELWRGSQFVKCFRHRGSVLLLRKSDGQSDKKLCFLRSPCV